MLKLRAADYETAGSLFFCCGIGRCESKSGGGLVGQDLLGIGGYAVANRVHNRLLLPAVGKNLCRFRTGVVIPHSIALNRMGSRCFLGNGLPLAHLERGEGRAED